MTVAYIRTLNPVGSYQLVEVINISAASPPPRPHPEPPLGIWGPTDPRPTHPIVLPGQPGPGGGGPVDPGYSPPWAQLPVDPGYGIPIGGGGGGGGHGPGHPATVIPLPPSDDPLPEGVPAGSTAVLIWFGPGTQPAMAWVAPYASTGPVTPPATPGAAPK